LQRDGECASNARSGKSEKKVFDLTGQKGGKRHEMPCHHNLETYLTAYLEKTGIADDLKGQREMAGGTYRETSRRGDSISE
jgi:hypothetical protein